jgi:uncharacterized protein YabE (DUF348 family)
MKSILRDVLRNGFIVGILIVLVVIGAASVAFASYVDRITHEVTLNDDGNIVHIATMQETVEALLEEYEIELGPGDVIKPGLKEMLADDTTVEIDRAFEVNVMADGKVEEVYLTDGTVEYALKLADVTIGEGDLINYDLEEPLIPGVTIQIERAFKVSVKADGKVKEVYLTEGTVEDALELADIEVREKDEINLDLGDFLKPGTVIEVNRIEEEVLTEEQTIPYKVVTKKNNSMKAGVEKVAQEGKQGKKQVKTLVVYRDGAEISRELVEEEVIDEPVNRIVEVGTQRTTENSRGDVMRYKDVKTMVASAYHAGVESTGKKPGDSMYGITKSGKKVRNYHTIAAPTSIPLGTKVYIPYMVEYWKKRGVEISGVFVVEDRGSAITGNRIDIYIEDLAQCNAFGLKNVKVYFLN